MTALPSKPLRTVTVHARRTLMLKELSTLFDAVPLYSEAAAYRRAVVDENILLKHSYGGREETYTNLRRLYGLDEQDALFAVLRGLWQRDILGKPLLALLAAYSVDEILRSTAPVILGTKGKDVVMSEQLAAQVAKAFPDRYNQVTLEAIGQRAASSWTQSGHLQGKVKKVRSKVQATSATMAFALFIGTLTGERGYKLFNTLWVQLLDLTEAERDNHASLAAKQGYLSYRRLGDVAEVDFNNFFAALKAQRV